MKTPDHRAAHYDNNRRAATVLKKTSADGRLLRMRLTGETLDTNIFSRIQAKIDSVKRSR